MDEVRRIAKLYLEKLKRQMERQGKGVEVTEAAVNLLTEKGYSTAYGARFLKRHMTKKLSCPLPLCGRPHPVFWLTWKTARRS
jgi:ATP-dependent Clp protease ATP-binding subunit ClpA